jgi:hypothetical protein
VSTPRPMLGPNMSVPSVLLGFGRELSLTFLRSGVKLNGHSTLSPPYPEPELIIMMPIKYNKPSMLTLTRCDGTISKIILSYCYKITSLPLLRCMK